MSMIDAVHVYCMEVDLFGSSSVQSTILTSMRAFQSKHYNLISSLDDFTQMFVSNFIQCVSNYCGVFYVKYVNPSIHIIFSAVYISNNKAQEKRRVDANHCSFCKTIYTNRKGWSYRTPPPVGQYSCRSLRGEVRSQVFSQKAIVQQEAR